MKMNIAVAANRTFEKYLYVMLTSLLENSKDQEICVYCCRRILDRSRQIVSTSC